MNTDKRKTIVFTTTIDYQLRYHRELIIELANRQWYVKVVSSGGPILEKLAEHPNVDAVELQLARNPHPTKDFVGLWRWYRLLRQIRPDVLFSGTPKASLLSLFAGRLARIKTRVYFIHGLRFQGDEGVKRQILRVLERFTIGHSTVAVAVSGSVQEYLARSIPSAASKVMVIGSGSANGVDLDRFSYRERRPTQSSAPRLGFIGRINRDKGLDILASALAQLPPQTRYSLRLVGEVEGEQGFRLLENLRHVKPDLTHERHREDVEEIYSEIDILCIPSRREGMSTVVLEAMASGVVVVGTPVTGILDLVVDGQTGMLAPSLSPGTYSRALLQAIRTRQSTEISARAHALIVEHFNQEIVIQCQADFIQDRYQDD